MEAMRIQLQAKRRTYQKSCQPMAPGSPFTPPATLVPGGNADGNAEIFLSSSQAPAPTAIPTLSEWSQIGMAALLVGGGLLAIRKRSA